MSRGPGHVQRTILASLPADGWLSARELAREVYGTATPAEHQERAVRRAVAGLRDAGSVQTYAGRVLLVALPPVAAPGFPRLLERLRGLRPDEVGGVVASGLAERYLAENDRR